MSSKEKKITNKTGYYLQEYKMYGNEVFDIWIKRREKYYAYLDTIKTKINVINVCDDVEWPYKLRDILNKNGINVIPYYFHSKSTDKISLYDKKKYVEIFNKYNIM